MDQLHPNIAVQAKNQFKAFFNALNIKFEETAESPYNQSFVRKVNKIRKSKNRTEIDPKDLWGSLGLH